MDKIKLQIDEKEVQGEKGDVILKVALDNEIYIPHLCYFKNVKPALGSCRLCIVEIDGKKDPVTSCSEPIRDGMVIKTNTEKINKFRKIYLDFILSDHYLDCKTCSKKGKCEIVKVTRYIGAKLKRNPKLKNIPDRNLIVDNSHPKILFDQRRCILCSRCVWVSQESKKCQVLDFAYRGYRTKVTTFNNIPLGETKCLGCDECISVCPTGALSRKVENG